MKPTLIPIVIAIFSSNLSANGILGLPAIPIPSDNPQNTTKIALGKKIFHDPGLSADGTISCATCHQPGRAFTDGLARAKGLNQIAGTRNTPSVINSAFYRYLFLDGRRDSLENQALDPILNPVEHGLISDDSLVTIITNNAEYPPLFSQSFGIQPEQISTVHIAKALASYERTLIAGNSPFDLFFFGANRQTLSISAVRGLRLFRRKANCANCHEISWNNALFTDNRFYNIGVGFKRIAADLPEYIESLTKANSEPLVLTNQQMSELGRFNVTHVPVDIGKFKTPSLRNIALTAPYMHDGSFKSLEQVIDYYNTGGEKNPYLDPAIFPLNLSRQEKSDLAAFLRSLTSPLPSDDPR